MNNLIAKTEIAVGFAFYLPEVGEPIRNEARELADRAVKLQAQLDGLKRDQEVLLREVRSLWKRKEINQAKVDAVKDGWSWANWFRLRKG